MNPFTKKYSFKDDSMPPLNEVCEGLTEDDGTFWVNKEWYQCIAARDLAESLVKVQPMNLPKGMF